jgi:hypothetical protein
MNRVPNPSDQPIINLTKWTILEMNGVRVFIGQEQELSHRIRISTPLIKFDPETMTGVTRSGRIYNLIGEPRPEPLEDSTVRYAAGIWGIDLDQVTVIEIARPSPRLH